MGNAVLEMSVSVDGYVAGLDDGPDNPGGGVVERLHAWAFDVDFRWFRTEGVQGEMMRQVLEVGAVVVGRRTAEQVDHWGGAHPGGVDGSRRLPVFVPSHRPPGPTVADYPLVTYVPDIETAVARAKEAAGERDVHVIGAVTGQTGLAAGVIDILQLHYVPVLLGSGRRLFDLLPARVELEILRVVDTPEVTHVRYAVRR